MSHSILAAAEVLLGRIFSRRKTFSELAIVEVLKLTADGFQMQMRYENGQLHWWLPTALDDLWEPRFSEDGAVAAYRKEVDRMYGRPTPPEEGHLWCDAWGDLYIINRCYYNDTLDVLLELEFADKHMAEGCDLQLDRGRFKGEILLSNLKKYFRKISD